MHAFLILTDGNNKQIPKYTIELQRTSPKYSTKKSGKYPGNFLEDKPIIIVTTIKNRYNKGERKVFFLIW